MFVLLEKVDFRLVLIVLSILGLLLKKYSQYKQETPKKIYYTIRTIIIVIAIILLYFIVVK